MRTNSLPQLREQQSVPSKQIGSGGGHAPTYLPGWAAGTPPPSSPSSCAAPAGSRGFSRQKKRGRTWLISTSQPGRASTDFTGVEELVHGGPDSFQLGGVVMAITGAHVLLYSSAAEELRAVFRDVFNWKFVDAGDGWLIFALPPAELGVHPAEGPTFEAGTRHQFTLMCDDITATVRELREKGHPGPGRARGRRLGHQRRARASWWRGGAAVRTPPRCRCRNPPKGSA